MWANQDRHPGDRLRLFAEVDAACEVSTVLYPGSFVDIAPSFVFADVTYVDTDRRAARFFADEDGVAEIVAGHRSDEPAWRFLAADYTTDLGLPDDHFDLLVSLYAGFVSAACARYLRIGGLLLANPSHGDVALASLDPRFRLDAVVTSHSGAYRVRRDDLDSYLIPKAGAAPTVEEVRRTGRGVAYTRPAFAYVFRRVA